MRGALLVLTLVGCGDRQELPDAGPVDPEAAAEMAVLERALEIRRCAGDALGVSGVYAVAFETAAQVSGPASAAQREVMTRYAVAQLCGEQYELTGRLLVCNFAQTPVLHEASRTCAAEVPSLALLAEIPVAHFRGETSLNGNEVALSGWTERWGLLEDAELPREPGGAAAVQSPELVDQDGDERPGITLRGDGPVPTVSWAARITSADFALGAVNGGLQGHTRASTRQTIVGGPAARLLRGWDRGDAPGDALFVRADGTQGSTRLDGNGDGLVSCAEVVPWVGTVLPNPSKVGCEPDE